MRLASKNSKISLHKNLSLSTHFSQSGIEIDWIMGSWFCRRWHVVCFTAPMHLCWLHFCKAEQIPPKAKRVEKTHCQQQKRSNSNGCTEITVSTQTFRTVISQQMNCSRDNLFHWQENLFIKESLTTLLTIKIPLWKAELDMWNISSVRSHQSLP